jgi:hypothetical protein
MVDVGSQSAQIDIAWMRGWVGDDGNLMSDKQSSAAENTD